MSSSSSSLPPSQSILPFVEFVLRSLEHPPFMFVSKLAACCATLYLAHSDTELLDGLVKKWAARFVADRSRLIDFIHRRARQGKGGKAVCPCNVPVESAPQDGAEHGDTEVVARHLLRILDSLVPMYFSWNWHRAEYVIVLNKEYEAYVRENILPLCIACNAEDGVDDDESMPWLIPPSVYSANHSVASPTSPARALGAFYGPPNLLRLVPDGADGTVCGGSHAHLGPGQLRRTQSSASVSPIARVVGLDTGSSSHGVTPARCTPSRTTTSSVQTSNLAAEYYDDSALTFLTVTNYMSALRANRTGLVTVFHAKYSVRSNTVLQLLQEIVRQELLDPMPTIAVVYAVAEPELASLYNVSWFPTIIYTPPLPTSQSTHSLASCDADGAVTTATTAPTTARDETVSWASAGCLSPSEMLFGVTVDRAPARVTTRDASATRAVRDESHKHDAAPEADAAAVVECDDEDALAVRIARDGHRVYPAHGAVTVSALVRWLRARGEAAVEREDERDLVLGVRSLRAAEKLRDARELHSAVVMLRRLQGDDPARHGTGAAVPGTPTCRRGEPPLFIFLGGGMAAGKSTAATALALSAWWKAHKAQSVLVNADEFKVAEPLYEGTSDDMHARSTRAAESLLVHAVNQGRSVVLDGTMMWAPFVEQVIAMVRKADTTLFQRGPGYRERDERYFTEVGPRPVPLPVPYRIRFIGITVEPEVAVPRGIMRKFATGRGVPIEMQLRSFKLFAANFEKYASLVDSVMLLNNNVFVDLKKGELPPVLALRNETTNDELRINDPAAYALFLRQQTLNEHAGNILELYRTPPDTAEGHKPNATV